MAAWCEAHRPEVAALLSKGTGVPLDATQRAVDRNVAVTQRVTKGDIPAVERLRTERFAASEPPRSRGRPTGRASRRRRTRGHGRWTA